MLILPCRHCSGKEQWTWFRVNLALGCPGGTVPCAVTNLLICKWGNLEPKKKWWLTPLPLLHSLQITSEGPRIEHPSGLPKSLSDAHKTGNRQLLLPSLGFLILPFSSSTVCSLSAVSTLSLPPRLPGAWQQPQIHFNIKEAEHLRGKNWVSVCLVSCWMILDFNLSQ